MSQKMGAKIFFGPNTEDWGVYLGKYVEKYRGKIKNENRHETGLRSPEIGKRPPQALGGGGSGFFGLGGPNHNAPTQFPEKNFLPAWQSVWFLASHTLNVIFMDMFVNFCNIRTFVCLLVLFRVQIRVCKKLKVNCKEKTQELCQKTQGLTKKTQCFGG